jgi:hypothetical protein
MSLFRTANRGQAPAAAAILVALGLGAAQPAAAQELGGLRGTISDAAQADPATDPAPVSAIPGDPYQPLSDGAVADEEIDPADDTATADMPDFSAPSAAEDDASNRQEQAGASPQQGTSSSEDRDAAELRIRRIDTRVEGRNEAADSTNLRTGAIERIARTRDEEPFAPVGLRVGTFNVFPQLEQGLTATNNADQSPTGGSAILSESTLRLKAVSDWSSSEATVDAYGTLRRSLSGQDIADFEGALNSDLRLDITSSLRGLASFDYALFPEDASSPVSIAGVDSRPLHHVIEGSLGAEKALGRLRLRLTGDVLRDQFGDAELTDGTTLPQDDRNSTLATVRLRGGYQISPALTPFAEAEFGRRFYDQERDSSGYARSANRMAARAGIALDLREKLSGEFSAGWVNEDPEDERLQAISGPTVAASLVWSPVRETTVRLDGSTFVEGSTTPGETGSILYSGLLTAERQMRSNLTGSAALGLGYRTYDTGGHDTIASAELGLTWWLNRYAGVTGRARYELLRSDLADRDYDAASVFLGMTVQR